MTNNLKLITTETFGDLSCNFYRSMNDDILLTREQIGTALEYVNPDASLSMIHKRHKDRLDPLSEVTKLLSTDGKEYETILYTQRGVMEICRWSKSNKANQFMDWVWDIVEKYRNHKLTQQIDMTPITEAITYNYKKLEIWKDIKGYEGLNLQHSNIIKCCKGERNMTVGMKWSYYDISLRKY